MGIAPSFSTGTDFTLSLCFDAASEQHDEHGRFTMTGVSLNPGRMNHNWTEPVQDGSHALHLPLAPDTRLYITILEKSGQVHQTNFTVSKCWFVGNLRHCPLLAPIPTETSPWTVVFRGATNPADPSSCSWSSLGMDGFAIQSRTDHKSHWPFRIFLSVLVDGVHKTFKFDGDLVLEPGSPAIGPKVLVRYVKQTVMTEALESVSFAMPSDPSSGPRNAQQTTQVTQQTTVQTVTTQIEALKSEPSAGPRGN